jgi:site-specific recombinase XerD
VTAFPIDKEAQGLSVRTIQLYAAELGCLRNRLRDRGVRSLLDVTYNTIRRWLIQLAQTRNSGGVHVNYRALKTFLR